MKDTVRDTALRSGIRSEIKFADQGNGSLSPDKNAEQIKNITERCKEVKLELARARRIL